jgi:uncharacterized protein (TIGR02453 family)
VPRIGPPLFRFLRELETHNRREWFADHKTRYETEVRDAMLAFIRAFGPLLTKINPHFVADPRPVGGSLMRIYRDTRFSKDKSPYKTHVAAHFSHASAKDWTAPSFYVHLAPNEVFAGMGVWHPEPEVAQKIRQAIADDPAAWKKATSPRTLKSKLSFTGESLVRAPRGFDPKHPLVEDLKRRDFCLVQRFTEADACGPNFHELYAEACRNAAPFMQFLTRAVGLKW